MSPEQLAELKELSRLFSEGKLELEKVPHLAKFIESLSEDKKSLADIYHHQLNNPS